jgi:hypothetical protein
MQNTLSLKDIKAKVAKAIFILFFIQMLIALLVSAFYKYRYTLLSTHIDLTAAYPPDYRPNNALITTRENLFWKDIIGMVTGQPVYYFLGRILFGIIPTKFELQRPKPKKLHIEIHRLYCRSMWQYAGFIISNATAISICEKIAFGSGLLGKHYISTWGSLVSSIYIIVALLVGYIIHQKRWKKVLASLSPTEQ